MIAEETRTLSLDEKLNSGNWKARLEGYEEFLQRISVEKQSLTAKYIGMFPKFLTESTPSAMEKGLQVVCRCLQSEDQSDRLRQGQQELDVRQLFRNLVEKILSANRPNLDPLANELLVTVYKIGDKEAMGDVLKELIGQKNPKVAQAAISTSKELLVNFGPKDSHWQSLYQKILPKCSDPNPQVRTLAMDYFKKLGQYQGASLLNILKSLKPVQLSEIKSHIESNPKLSDNLAAPKQVVGVIEVSDQGNTGMEMQEEDLWQHMPAVKVLQKFNEAWTDKLIGEAKWTEKKQKLESMERALSIPKIEPANCTHIAKMLKKMLSDSNVAVQMAALAVIKKLCKGLRTHFSQGLKSLNRSLLHKLKERKPLVSECVIETIVASFQTCGLEDVIDEYRDQMKEKNPHLKCNIMKIFGQYINTAGLKCLKNSHFSKTVFNCAKENLNDGSPEVRKASTSILGNMFKIAPKDHFVIKEIEKLDEKRRNKILEMSRASATASICGSVTNQRSPTQEISCNSADMRSHLKKSQSVSKYPVPNKETGSLNALGKKSVPQLTTNQGQGAMVAKAGVITKPATGVQKVFKKSHSSIDLSSQPTLSSMLEEMKHPMPHEEAGTYLIKECSVPADKVNQLGHSNWKLRQQALLWFKTSFDEGKISDPQGLAQQAVLVLSKKHTNDFKESNINIVKELMELASSLSSTSDCKSVHLIVEAIVEKLPLNKFGKHIDDALNVISQNHGLRKLMSSFLGNAKEKTYNPRITASVISKIKDQIIAKSEDVSTLPYRELVSFCKGSLLNPNIQVRHTSLELLAVMIHFNNDVTSMISDVSAVQKSMINSELCKLNTLLNTSSDKDLNKTLVRSIMEDMDRGSQAINLQLLIDNFRQKKGIIPEDMRDQFFRFVVDALGSGEPTLTNLCLDLAPVLCRKYRKESEKHAQDLIKLICGQIRSPAGSCQATASLQGIFDCLGGPIFASVPEFAALTKSVKSHITRMQGLHSADKMDIESIDLEDKPKVREAEKDMIAMDLENIPDSLENSNSYLQRKEKPSKLKEDLTSELAKEKTLDRVFKPVQNSPQKSSQEVPQQTPKEARETSQSRLAPDASGKRSVRRSRLASKDNSEALMTLEDVGSNIQWKSHQMDYREPKDDQIRELRRIIKAEMGDDLAEMMFSYEKSRIIEAVQKVKTRMKQKCELSGFWEIMLKWALVRVYDCSRDEVLKEFSKFVINIINFSDRGGRHLALEEAILLLHIEIQILANEDTSSITNFSSTFGYHLILEHRETLVLTLLQTIIPEPYKKSHLRSLVRCIDFATLLIQMTQTMVPETLFSSLVNLFALGDAEIDLSTRKLACSSLKQSPEQTQNRLKDLPGVMGQCVKGYLFQGESYLAQFEVPSREEACQTAPTNHEEGLQQNSRDLQEQHSAQIQASGTQPVKSRELSSTLNDLKADIDASKANTDLKNVVTLKKIVDLVKARNDDSDYFLQTCFVSVVNMISYMLRIQLMNDASYSERIPAIQSNYEFVKTVLEYVQKICGSSVILKCLGELRYTNLMMQLIDSLVVVDSDKRLLEANQDDLYSDRAMRIRDTMSKFINSAILRLMEGPPNMVFAVLFSLMTAYSGFQDRDAAVRESKAIKLKIAARLVVKVSSVVESLANDLDVTAVLQMNVKYLEACQAALCLDNNHLGVKTVKTVVYDLVQAYPRRVQQELIRMNNESQAYKLICHWSQIANTSTNMVTHIVTVPDLLMPDAPEISEPTENTPEPMIVEAVPEIPVKNPDHSETLKAKHTEERFSVNQPKPLHNNIPLPMPGMPFKRVSGPTAAVKNQEKSPDIQLSVDDRESRQSPWTQDYRSPAQEAVSRKKVPAFQLVDRNQSLVGKISAQRGSVSDYSQYKESFLRSSVDKDSISEIPLVCENHSDVNEIKSIGADEKKMFQSFGQKSEHSPKSEERSSSEKKKLIEPVKYIPSDVLSLGKRSAIEKHVTEEIIISLESPVKLIKSKSPYNSGKLSIDLKERQSPSQVSAAARIFEDIDRDIDQPNSETKKHVLSPIENQRTLFSTNLIASNISPGGSAVKDTYRPSVNLVDMKLKFKQSGADAKDQTLLHLITRFKKSMLIDYRQKSKEIHDYLYSLPKDRRPALAEYLQELTVVQKSYLMNELSQGRLAEESQQDENIPNSFNEVCEKLALIRQKYKTNPSGADTPPINTEAFTESLEYKAREKRIGDFRQKIHDLLRQKQTNLN